jgi:tetratricopeptide (TPR) repeat protein
MATQTVTPTPKPAKRRTKSKGDDGIPFFDGSYYLLVTQMVDAARHETGIANKVRAVRVVGSRLSPLRKLLAAALLVGLGAGLASGAYLLLVRRDAGALRREARAHLAAGALIEARRDLEALRVAVGDLTPVDRAELAEPLRARVEAQARKLRQEVESSVRLGRRASALAALDQLDALEADGRWTLFTRAEILRAGRHADASAAYERFVGLYPDSDLADDAVFWQALIAKDAGRAAEARALCERLLARYPKSNFRTASDRMLAELASPK